MGDIVGAVVINLGIENIIDPALTGKQLKLCPTVVFVPFLYCGWLLGSVAVRLSMPIAVLVLLVLESSDNTRWAARMIGTLRADE